MSDCAIAHYLSGTWSVLKLKKKEPDKTEKKRTVKYDKTQEILQGA